MAVGSVMLDRVDDSAGLVLRWCRALLLAGVALAAGVAGHLGADGLMPGPAALVVLFLACTVGAACLLGRPASRLRVVLLLIGGQTFIHGSLTALAGHRGDPPLVRAPEPPPVAHVAATSGAGPRVGSLLDQFNAAQAGNVPGQRVELAVPYPVQHLVADLTGAHAVMAVWHLAAAVVVGLWLAMGERALWTVVALAGDVAARVLEPALDRCRAAARSVHLVATTLSGARHRWVPAEAVLLPAESLVRTRPLSRRGPPAAPALPTALAS
jgi:hypothetical protein